MKECISCKLDQATCPVEKINNERQPKSIFKDVNLITKLLFSKNNNCNMYRQFRDILSETKEQTQSSNPNQLTLFSNE